MTDEPFDDGYPKSDFDERALGPPPDSWYWPPGSEIVVLSPDDRELLRGMLDHAREQRERARQEGMKAFFASLAPAKPLPTVAEDIAGIMRAIEEGKQRAAMQHPLYKLLSGMNQCSS